MKLRVHATEARSRANGPGSRFVVWMQGCTLGCPGCFNPATHPEIGGREVTVDALVAEIVAAAEPIASPGFAGARSAAAGGAEPIEGVSLSGGEPLQQAEGAAALLAAVRAHGLSTLAFSGYTLDEIRALPHGPEVLAQLDVVIDGRYVASERLATGLRGSANQRIQLLTQRYTLADVEATPVAEIRISPTGDVVLTGVNPLKLKR